MTRDQYREPAVRVLWLITGLARGGAEQLLLAAAQRLDRGRFEVEVAYVLAGYDALVPRFEAVGVPVHGLGAKSVSSLGWVRQLRALVATRGYDILHTHSPAPASIARVALGRRIRFVHTEHSSWHGHHPTTRLLNAATYRRNAAVLAVSNAVADSIRTRSGRPPVEVVYHGIDLQAVRQGPAARAEARAALGLDPAGTVIGAVGNFSPAKGHDTLLAAFAKLGDRELRLALIGFGPLEAQLRSQATALGIGDRVVFAGSRDDVPAILPAFDIFVLPSLREGLGLAMLEAMATGIPCVATRIPAVVESLRDDEAALLVPPGDAAALAAAISRLLTDDQARATMGQAGEAVAVRFSLERSVQRLGAVYGQVSGSAPRRDQEVR